MSDANTYTYTMQGTAASPATGTIQATFAVIQGLTNASGVIDSTYSYSADQPISGRARLSTTSPLYVSQPFTATVDSTAGVSVNVALVSDE